MISVSHNLRERFSREICLILALARKEVGPDALRDLEDLLSVGIDWDSVLELAYYHRVDPLLYRNLKLNAWDAVPSSQGERLSRAFFANQGRMMSLTAELIRLTGSLKSEGIEAISLKGPVLAASLYDNVAMRYSGDLDILVRPGDLPQALNVFRRCGYRVHLGSSSEEVSANQEVAIRRFHYHYILYHEGMGHTVELHFRLFGGKLKWGSSTDQAFENMSVCEVGGSPINVLSDAENLLFLCLHGGKHAWSRLEWIVSMAEILRRTEGLDEKKLWSLAEQRAAGPALLLGISLADRYFGIPPFKTLREKAGNRHGIEKLSVTVDELLENPGLVDAGEKIAPRFHWELCDTVGRRLHLYVTRKLIPNCSDVAAADWSPPWQFLYYLGPFRRLLSVAGDSFRGDRKEG